MPFDGKYGNLQMLCFCTFAFAPTIDEILTWYFLPWKTRSRWNSQWCYSMEILKSINVTSCSFAQTFTVFEIFTFEIFDLDNIRSRSKNITLAMMPFDSKYWNLQKSTLAVLRQLAPFSRYWHLKYMNLKKLVHVTECNTGNVAGRLQMSKSINVIFTLFIFPKIWPVRTILITDTHTATSHAHGYRKIYIFSWKVKKKGKWLICTIVVLLM